MFKGIISLIAIVSASSAFAFPTLTESLALTQQTVMSESVMSGLNWKVGDQNSYSVDMGFIQGSMVMSVRSIDAEGIWVDQNMDLGFAGKQNASMLHDPATGQIKKFLVNGKEQSIPENNFEIVEITEDKVTVPAGTFDCIHAKLKDKSDGKEANAWINPEKVSIGGSLKMIQPSQFGNVTIALKSFKRN